MQAMGKRFGLLFIATAILLTSCSSTPHAKATAMDLPIAALTPGATNPLISQANIATTICVNGFTKSIRPPASYTYLLKYTQLRGPYSRYKNLKAADFEEDHLIPLGVGGDPYNAKNLWPQARGGAINAEKKNDLESLMHQMVCNKSITLQKAQEIFASNWYTGWLKYVA